MGLFGGSNKTTVTNQNTTNVDVGVAVENEIDLSPLQRAIEELAAANLIAQKGLLTVQRETAATLADAQSSLGDALFGSSESAQRTQVVVAVIGLVGVLIAAHVIVFPRVSLR